MIYWLLLFLIIGSIYLNKKNASFYFNIALYAFMIGAILRIIGLNSLAEIIMRIDFMLWLVGFALAIKENKHENTT